jgi:L-amino acid N-acyltransferase YncA
MDNGGAAAVRAASARDLEAVGAIYAHWVTTSTATFEETPPTTAEWRARLHAARRRGLPFLVAEAAGEVTGYAYCAPWRSRPAYRHTVEDSVYVAPHGVGRGTGRALLTGLLERCAGAGVREVVAVIARPGEAAPVRLHRRCGFVVAGRLSGVGYKHGRWLDTLLLQRALRP